MTGWIPWPKKGELPRESSLSIEGRSPWAEPPRRESGDPDLGGDVMTGGEWSPRGHKNRPILSEDPSR
jgi:hypothetical protein